MMGGGCGAIPVLVLMAETWSLMFFGLIFMLSMPTSLETNILDVHSECPVLIHLVDMASMKIWATFHSMPQATDTF